MDGRYMLQGTTWPPIMGEGIGRQSPVKMRRYLLPSSFDAGNPWTLLEGPDVTYCITSWFPTIDVGRLRFDDEASGHVFCDHFKSIEGLPRSFSFFKALSQGFVYRHDAWILMKSSKAYAAVSMMVVIDTVRWQLKSYTYPFFLKGPDPTYLCQAPGDVHIGIFEQISEQGDWTQAFLTVAYSAANDGISTWSVERLPLTALHALIVGVPEDLL